MDKLQLHILSPEGTVLKTEAGLVSLPGLYAPFTVLPGHAPIITALVEGVVRYVTGGKEERLPIKEGFAEVKDNVVKLCVEL